MLHVFIKQYNKPEQLTLDQLTATDTLLLPVQIFLKVPFHHHVSQCQKSLNACKWKMSPLEK